MFLVALRHVWCLLKEVGLSEGNMHFWIVSGALASLLKFNLIIEGFEVVQKNFNCIETDYFMTVHKCN
jgi:hypothetical protein